MREKRIKGGQGEVKRRKKVEGGGKGKQAYLMRTFFNHS